MKLPIVQLSPFSRQLNNGTERKKYTGLKALSRCAYDITHGHVGDHVVHLLSDMSKWLLN
jgi:hypothetical protein